MPDTNKTMVKFKYGSYEGFKGLTSYDAGTIYVTTDEQGLYFAKNNVDKPIKLGNIITYDSLSDFNENTQPPYSADVFYYITNGNMLFKYSTSEGKFVQLNKDYGTDVKDIKDVIGTKEDEATIDTLWGQINKAQAAAAGAQSTANEGLGKATANAGEITTIKGNITTIGGQITSLDGRLSTVEGVAAENKAAIEDTNTGLSALSGKIGGNATAISELDKYVKETVEPKAQQGITDAKTADDKAVAARGVADAAKATADANKLAIENETTGLGALNTKVGELASEDARLAEEIGKVDAKAAANTAEFAKYYTKEEIDAELDAITGGTGTGSLAGLKDYVDEQVEDLEGAIGEVSTAVSDLETAIGNLENLMNFVGTLTGTEDENGKVTITSAGVHGDVGIYEGQEYVFIATNPETSLTTGTWEPIGAVSAQEARFQGIETRLGTAEGKITTAEGEIDTLQTDVGDLKTTVGGHTTKLGTIEGNISTLDGKIDGVAGNLTAEAERADTAEKALDKKITDLDAAYKAKDSELSSAIAGVRTDFEAADETINGKIDGLTTRLNALDTAETGKVPVLEAGLAAEIDRAKKAESDLDTAYKAADAETKSYIDDALTWGTF